MSLYAVRGALTAVWLMLLDPERNSDPHLCSRIDRMEAVMGDGVVRVQVGLSGPSAVDLTNLSLLALPVNLRDGWELKRVVILDGHTVQFTLL